MSRPIVISTNQGNVTGKVVSVKPELTDKKCISFQGIPFGRYERFQKPTRFGKWKGTLDGTGEFLDGKKNAANQTKTINKYLLAFWPRTSGSYLYRR